jgi:hypothetical protein
MIPKLGDQVTLDPWYKDRMRDALTDDIDEVFGASLKVVHVVEDGLWLSVTVSAPRIHTFRVTKKTGNWYDGDLLPALFMPTTEALAKAAIASSELKVRNTDPEDQTCVKCGDALIDPVPGVPIFRHCSVCEP